MTTTANRRAAVDYGDLPDEELMEQLSHRDIAALETLYDRYATAVYYRALHVVKDAHLAEDISQDVFLRLWRQAGKYAPRRGPFVNWLFAVTRNRAIDELRARQRSSRHDTLLPAQREREVPALSAHDPALAAELAEQRRAVRGALASLPPGQRQAIELAYFGGLSNREMADLLGWPLGTVKTRIRLGIQKLRKPFRATDEAQDDQHNGRHYVRSAPAKPSPSFDPEGGPRCVSPCSS